MPVFLSRELNIAVFLLFYSMNLEWVSHGATAYTFLKENFIERRLFDKA